MGSPEPTSDKEQIPPILTLRLWVQGHPHQSRIEFGGGGNSWEAVANSCLYLQTVSASGLFRRSALFLRAS